MCCWEPNRDKISPSRFVSFLTRALSKREMPHRFQTGRRLPSVEKEIKLCRTSTRFWTI